MHPLVDKLGLAPHPEGGFFRQIYQSKMDVTSPAHGLIRPAVTHIYFLLLKGQVSRFHRVLHDEIWNHYEGAPLTLYQLHQQQLHEKRLGGPDDEKAAIIPAGQYQAAQSTGEYSLVGCSVAPGFDFADFSFIDEPSMSHWLEVAYPEMVKFL